VTIKVTGHKIGLKVTRRQGSTLTMKNKNPKIFVRTISFHHLSI
jgi:hypothetical protein